MSAPHIISDQIDVTISDVQTDGNVAIEVDVKVAGTHFGKRSFVGEIGSGAVKVAAEDKAAYWALAVYVPPRLALHYAALV